MRLLKGTIILFVLFILIIFYATRWHPIHKNVGRITVEGDIRYIPFSFRNTQISNGAWHLQGVFGTPHLTLLQSVKVLYDKKVQKASVYTTNWSYKKLYNSTYDQTITNGQIILQDSMGNITAEISGYLNSIPQDPLTLYLTIDSNQDLITSDIMLKQKSGSARLTSYLAGSLFSHQLTLNTVHFDSILPGVITGDLTWQSLDKSIRDWQNMSIELQIDSLNILEWFHADFLLKQLNGSKILLDYSNLSLNVSANAQKLDLIHVDTITLSSDEFSVLVQGEINALDSIANVEISGVFLHKALKKMPEEVTMFLIPHKNGSRSFNIKVKGRQSDYIVELSSEMLEQTFSSFDGALFQ